MLPLLLFVYVREGFGMRVGLGSGRRGERDDDEALDPFALRFILEALLELGRSGWEYVRAR